MISIISIILLLFITGKMVFLVLPQTTFIRDKDIFQEINLNIYVGLVYILFSITTLSVIFNNFNLIVTISYTVLILLSSRKIKATIKKPSLNDIMKKINFIDITLLIISFFIINKSYQLTVGNFSTADDAAFHTFLIRLILENPKMILTGSSKPYADFYIAYPMLPHIFSATIYTLKLASIEKLVLTSTSIMPFLIGTSFYQTTKTWFNSKILSTITTIIAYFSLKDIWITIGWGGLPFLFSLYFTVTSTGLISNIIQSNDALEKKIINTMIILIVSIYVYPVSVLYIGIWITVETISSILKNKISIKKITHEFYNLKIKETASMIPLFIFNIPYIYRIYNMVFIIKNSNYPIDLNVPNVNEENVQLIKNILDIRIIYNINKSSTFFSTNFSKISYITPYVVGMILILICVYILESKRQEKNKIYIIQTIKIYAYYALIIIYIVYLTNYSIGNAFLSEIMPLIRVFRQLSIFAVIFPSIIIYYALYLIKQSYTTYIKDKNKKYLLSIVIITILFQSIIIYNNNLITEQYSEFNDRITGTKNLIQKYSVITQDDLEAFEYIKNNTPENAKFLVTASDAGQYLTAITGRDSIYEFGLQLYSESYQDLLFRVNRYPDNQITSLELDRYNISYIYIGAKKVDYDTNYPFRQQFNATQILDSNLFTEFYIKNNSVIIKRR